MRVRTRPRPSLQQRGIVAENIGSLALYSESTVKYALYESGRLVRFYSENRCALGLARGSKGALEAFDSRHQKIQVCTEKFEEFDARTGMG